MKTRTLYIVVFVLVVITILALFYTKEKVSELTPQLSKVSQEEINGQEAFDQPAGPIFFHKQAITVVKPAQGRKTSALELDKVIDIEDQQESIIPSQSSPAVGEAADSRAAQEAAGVTRGKYPTLEEVKEMNSKGIVMY